MYLLEKGRKARAICRECRALHGEKDCARRIDAIVSAAIEGADLTLHELRRVTGLSGERLNSSLVRLERAGRLELAI